MRKAIVEAAKSRAVGRRGELHERSDSTRVWRMRCRRFATAPLERRSPGYSVRSSQRVSKFWLQHPELGSPLSAETGLDDGTVAQAFAHGIVQWTPQKGAWLV